MPKVKQIRILAEDRRLTKDSLQKIDAICGSCERVHTEERHPLLETISTYGRVEYAKRISPSPTVCVDIRKLGGRALHQVRVNLEESGEAIFVIEPQSPQLVPEYLPDILHAEEMVLPSDLLNAVKSSPTETIEATLPIRAAQELLYFIETSHINRPSLVRH